MEGAEWLFEGLIKYISLIVTWNAIRKAKGNIHVEKGKLSAFSLSPLLIPSGGANTLFILHIPGQILSFLFYWLRTHYNKTSYKRVWLLLPFFYLSIKTVSWLVTRGASNPASICLFLSVTLPSEDLYHRIHLGKFG